MTTDELRAAMQALGMTRQQTADALAVSIETLHGWMTPGGKKGRSISPTAARVMSWAVARGGFPPDWPTT